MIGIKDLLFELSLIDKDDIKTVWELIGMVVVGLIVLFALLTYLLLLLIGELLPTLSPLRQHQITLAASCGLPCLFFFAWRYRKRAKAETFPQFPRFPPEIRQKIFEAACPAAEVQHLRAFPVIFRYKGDGLVSCGRGCFRIWPYRFHRRCDRRRTAGQHWLQTEVYESPVPALFFVCQEAREVLLRNTVVYFKSPCGYIGGLALEKSLCSALHAGTFSKLRHLAITSKSGVWNSICDGGDNYDNNRPFRRNRIFPPLPSLEFLQKFENLQTLYVVIHGAFPVGSAGQYCIDLMDFNGKKYNRDQEQLEAQTKEYLESQRVSHDQKIPKIKICLCTYSRRG